MIFLHELVLELIVFIYFALNIKPCHEAKTMDIFTIKLTIIED